MSNYYIRMCSLILRDIFVEDIGIVGDFLLRRKASPLSVILTNTKLSLATVKEALRILMQHFIVECDTAYRPTRSDFLFFIRPEQIIEMTRYPRYFIYTQNEIDETAREVLEEVGKCGQVATSKLIYICGSRVLNSNPEGVSEDVLYEQLVLFQDTILRLSTRKFITIAEPRNTETEGTPRNGHIVPNVDVKLLLAKLQKDKTKVVELNSMPDADILWKINCNQFQAEMRNVRVYQALEKKFESVIEPGILKVLIDRGFEKHPWENEGKPVSSAELKDLVGKLPDGKQLAEFLTEHLDIIYDDPKGFVSRLSNTHGGHFSFNMKIAVVELFWNTVDKVIMEKYGFQAQRIFRLVRTNGFVEQDAINEVGMIPGKDAKTLTYKLIEDNFVAIKEVRKTYTAAPPGKVAHVFNIDTNTVLRSLQEACYQSIINLKLRIRTESAKAKLLMLKEERITRILVNMTNKKCTEEQLNEFRELLTPPERTLIRRFKILLTRLQAGVVAADETLFITELYLRYHEKPDNKKIYN